MPNVLLLHYRGLTEDFAKHVNIIARFLDIPVTALDTPRIVAHLEFEYMKQRAPQLVPFGGSHMWEPEEFHMGVRRDYHQVLSRDDIQEYERIAVHRLGPECAYWLATGKEL